MRELAKLMHVALEAMDPDPLKRSWINLFKVRVNGASEREGEREGERGDGRRLEIRTAAAQLGGERQAAGPKG